MLDGIEALPVPGQQVVEPAHGMAVGHTFENVFEIEIRFDIVELGGLDEGADRCPTFSAAIRPSEQVILAPERDGPNGSFDRVVIELDAAILEETCECRPANQGIADRIRQPAPRRQALQLTFEPWLQGVDDGLRLVLAHF